MLGGSEPPQGRRPSSLSGFCNLYPEASCELPLRGGRCLGKVLRRIQGLIEMALWGDKVMGVYSVDVHGKGEISLEEILRRG